MGKLHILNKVGHSTFKEILQKCVYNSTFMFFNVFLFCLKGYSETLKFRDACQLRTKVQFYRAVDIKSSLQFKGFSPDNEVIE